MRFHGQHSLGRVASEAVGMWHNGTRMMTKLAAGNLDIAREYISNNCDRLYKVLFEHEFFDGPEEDISAALREYQNSDGGFGHGIEPDFLLPDSSPMATSVACQLLARMEKPPSGIVAPALAYFEHTFDTSRNGWWAVPARVNEYPHAPWWAYLLEDGCTVIDRHWGNPSSEIIGYFWKWQQHVRTIDVANATKRAVEHLRSLNRYESEHEIYCYIRMYAQVPHRYRRRLEPCLRAAIDVLMCTDESKWRTYVPKPLDFVQSPKHALYPEVQEHAERNCDFLVSATDNGVWHPTWTWTQFEDDWEHSSKNWTAILTIRNYRTLREFGWI